MAHPLGSADVREAVFAAVADHGPITFAEYMELALYGPGGYYERPPIGPSGDFVTSPHVHPIFAELLAGGIRDLHQELGAPRPFTIAEVGAGDGTLATQLTHHLADLSPDYVAIERSAGARSALATLDGIRREDLLPDGPQLVLAHELLDNLPFRRVRITPEGPREVQVGTSPNGHLREVLGDPGDLHVAAGLEPGEETVVPEGAFAFIDEVARVLTHGYALLIDYGSVGSPGGVTHGYRAHRVVQDPLDAPGTADITVGVDFDLIARHAQERGLTAFPSITQHRALVALGFEDWVRERLAEQHRLLDERAGLEVVRAWSARSQATLLVDPVALGRFRWLLLATPGLTPPAWLTRALP
jgi:NADH dehydrogenase [ubiquinone] 1 alpha subcomplex assembly factor 7